MLLKSFLTLFIIGTLNFVYTQQNKEEEEPEPTKSLVNDNFYVDKDGLYLVNDNNFDLFLKEFPFNLLFSFKHPCKLCRQIVPEILKTINPLQNLNTPVFVGKLNCTESPQTQIRLQIINYVHLAYFSEGIPMLYDGGRTGEDMVQWVREKFDPLIGEIKSVEEIEQLKKYSDSLVVFFGDNEDKYNEFFLNARPKETVLFVKCTLPECLEKYEMKSGDIRIFRKNDKRIYSIKSEEYQKDNLRKLIEDVIRGKVWKLDREVFELIFVEGNSALFIYSPKSEQKMYVEMLDEVYDFAKENGLKLVNCDLSYKFELKIKSITGFKNSELPLVVIHNTRGNYLKSFVMDKSKSITIENIKGFVRDFKNNNLPQYIKTQDAPRSQKSPVLEIVGSTLEATVVNSPKDVIVLFYAPWCKDCKLIWPHFMKAAEQLKENHDIVFGTFDAYGNDQKLFDLGGYPKIAIWSSQTKTFPVVTDKIYSDPNDILKWINENAYNKFNYDDHKVVEEKKEEEGEEKEDYKLKDEDQEEESEQKKPEIERLAEESEKDKENEKQKKDI